MSGQSTYFTRRDTIIDQSPEHLCGFMTIITAQMCFPTISLSLQRASCRWD